MIHAKRPDAHGERRHTHALALTACNPQLARPHVGVGTQLPVQQSCSSTRSTPDGCASRRCSAERLHQGRTLDFTSGSTTTRATSCGTPASACPASSATPARCDHHGHVGKRTLPRVGSVSRGPRARFLRRYARFTAADPDHRERCARRPTTTDRWVFIFAATCGRSRARSTTGFPCSAISTGRCSTTRVGRQLDARFGLVRRLREQARALRSAPERGGSTRR